MDFKKKLFLWDLSRYLILFFVLYNRGLFPTSAELLKTAPVLGSLKIGLEEFMSNDGHIWGDFYWMATGTDLRGQIWVFSMLGVVALDYLWAYKNSSFAGKLRIANWIIALGAYAGYTVFFPASPRYDYFIYAYLLAQYGWPVLLTVSAVISLAMMWLGVILLGGYLIHRSLEEDGNRWNTSVPVLLSLGIPGSGHIAVGKYRAGLFFLASAIIVWGVGFYMSFIVPFASFIPALLFWLYAANDVRKIMQAGSSPTLP